MLLGSEEIDAQVIDEAMAVIAPHHFISSGIRLAVADEDVSRAREILGLPAIPQVIPKTNTNPLWLMVVIAVAAFTVLFFGFKHYQVSKIERVDQDRNNDGKPDERTEFNRQGKPVTFYLDNNFDGNWDWKQNFQDGTPTHAEADLDFDSVFDATVVFKNGLAITETIRPGGEGNPLFRHEYEHGITKVTWFDSDRDGSWDERIDYDPMGREIKRLSLK